MIEVREQVWQQPELFSKWMEKVRVGRGVARVPNADKDIWFEEVKELELKPFLMTMGILAKSGKFFPDFQQFYEVFNSVRGSLGAGIKKNFCGNCIDGFVILLTDRGNGSAAANCKTCYPASSHAIDPLSNGLRWAKNPQQYNEGEKMAAEDKAKYEAGMRAKIKADFKRIGSIRDNPSEIMGPHARIRQDMEEKIREQNIKRIAYQDGM